MNRKVKKTGLQSLYLNRQFRKEYTGTTAILNIRRRLFPMLTTWMLIIFVCGSASAQDKTLVVRLAKLQIDSNQLESYKAALKEEIETSVRLEPGVLSLNAVSEKNNPTNITILEIYASEDAYKAHLETPHFKKYKSTSKEMVKSLELVETIPIALAAKMK